MTASPLGLPAELSVSYKESLKSYTRSLVFSFLNKCPRDPNTYVFQGDLLDCFNSRQEVSRFVSPVTFGKLLSEYTQNDKKFTVIKKRIQNKSAIVGLNPP